jgi:hypothetical protein
MMFLIVWALLTIQGCYYSVANSKQNFPDSPGERFVGGRGCGDIPAISKFHFYKAFGLQKTKLS